MVVYFKQVSNVLETENFPSFTEGLNGYQAVKRGAYLTIRTKMFPVLSMVYLPQNNHISTITVLDKQRSELIISRCSSADN